MSEAPAHSGEIGCNVHEEEKMLLVVWTLLSRLRMIVRMSVAL